MKNVHVLLTDKPSKFYSIDGKHKLANSTMAMDWYISSAGYKPHNIYITNYEEIKEGDYMYDFEENDIIQRSNFSDINGYVKKYCVKVILTTDQDLIADGVQHIDDEFLEWFVKNPSCEEVEVGYGVIRLTETDNKGYWISIPNTEFNMQIQETKQETLGYICPTTKKQCDDECCVSAKDCHLEASIGVLSEPKQETLEVKRNYEKHSLTKTKGYKLWCNIIQRCYNPKNHSYKYYGEKGVIMEDYFKNSYENFINWIKGIANYKKWLNSSELSLDRIDNTLGYVRGNIKFSTKTEQVENQNLRLDNKSGYKGVCYHKLNKKYGATITINKSKVFLGYYDTALEAALVYDNYVLKNNLNRKTNL
jgi:hypothetical protein